MKKLEFAYNDVSVLEMSYLLTNYNRWLDADRQMLVIDL